MITAKEFKMQGFSEAYQECYPILFNIAYTRAKHGKGALDELLSEARLLFVQAHLTYNRNKGTYKSWIKTCVRLGILNEARRLKGRWKYGRPTTVAVDPEKMTTVPAKHTNEFSKKLQSLSPEARQVVELTLNPPKELAYKIKGKDKPMAESALDAVFCFLKDAGWAASTITACFREISSDLL